MEMHELMSLPKIVDISKRKPGADNISDDNAPLNVLRKQAEKEAEVQRNFQKRYNKLKVSFLFSNFILLLGQLGKISMQ